MAKLLCSLCGKVKEARPLDMGDIVFSRYVQLIRTLGLSKRSGALGVCQDCMGPYRKMQADFSRHITMFSVAGAGFSIAYFYLTGNLLMSLLVCMSVCSLSLLHYCPPLKEQADGGAWLGLKADRTQRK